MEWDNSDRRNNKVGTESMRVQSFFSADLTGYSIKRLEMIKESKYNIIKLI